MELKVKDATIYKMEKRAEEFDKLTKKMKAVLRVPRLAKQFHDLMAEGKRGEFDCLEKVYDHHFNAFGQSLFLDDPQDPRSFNTITEQPKLEALSYAERSLIDRSLGSPSALNAE